MPDITTTPTRGYTSFNSGSATYVDVTFPAGTGQGRLTEGPHTGFMTGDGAPQVHIHDPQETLQRVIDGDHRSDFTVTIEETG